VSFDQALGFNEFTTENVVLEEICLRNSLVRTKEIVDGLGLEEIPIRNFRDTLMDVEFGSSITNPWDLRKFRFHVSTFTAPEILDEGFTIVEQQASDSGSYLIPADSVKVNDWIHIVEKMPVFPCGDILGMNLRVSQPLRNWNLSRWIAKPFLSLRRTTVPDDRETQLRISVMLKQFPSSIPIKPGEFQSPLRAYLMSEIEVFNQAISVIRLNLSDALAGDNANVYHCLENEKTPTHWHEVIGFNGIHNPSKFCKFLKAKRDFLADWAGNGGVSPHKIDVSHLTNIRGLLRSFLNEIVLQREATSDLMTFEYIIGDEKNEGTGLTLV
jgi:hypothetical protein